MNSSKVWLPGPYHFLLRVLTNWLFLNLRIHYTGICVMLYFHFGDSITHLVVTITGIRFICRSFLIVNYILNLNTVR